ncbi:protein of unknown function DUF1006 [Coraliomargarita akajimensis DSM 45221]|uniref:Cytoplasmic protein n=2 Tax=Coraliomargarita TaxID=442430 RepID=D5EL07_CORAD|nr:protein of unknown function DUF1006 [Coraliomargarita akajimensis DSM 45221]
MGPTLEQFRKRVIESSLFPPTTLAAALQRMGFVQADPIRSPARAQDLILRQRVRNYKAGDLEIHYPNLKLEEYYLFAYGIGSSEVWQHLYPNTESALNDLEQTVLDMVKQQSPMHPKDLERMLGLGRTKNYWGGFSRTTKLALESLHDRGALRVQQRQNGTRLYEPASLPATALSTHERFKQIVLATLRSMGPSTRKFLMSELRHFAYLETSRAARLGILQELIDSGQVRIDRIETTEYLSLSALHPSRILLDQVRLLAPFDPIVRDRERFEQLWGWAYRFEAYTPPAKRKLGYYAMPVLWQDRIDGWANAKVIDNQLQVQFGYHKARPAEPAYSEAAEREVAQLAQFLGLKEGAYSLDC